MLKPVSEIKANLGIEPNGRVQKFFTNTCYRYMDKYVPKDTGVLREVVNIQPESITYQSPYAHAQYVGYTKGPVRNYTTPRNWSILGQKDGKCRNATSCQRSTRLCREMKRMAINTNIVDTTELRITKLRAYLISIIDTLLTDTKYSINANMLSADPNNYSLDKIPTDFKVETWITGDEIHRDVYSFRSRNNYSQDTLNNLINIGFFEVFEKKIISNNEQGILPDIQGIEEIKCLNCGSMNNASTNTAEFDIQIEIDYREVKV